MRSTLFLICLLWGAGAWVTDIERRGLPGSDLLSAYMDTMRDHGQPIMRHWDRE